MTRATLVNSTFVGTLSADVAIGGLSATLSSTTGIDWPTSGTFAVQVGANPDVDAELVQVTRSGATLTLASAFTKAHVAGARIYLLIAAEDVNAKLTDPSGSNDDILQRKSGAWTNRTIAQLVDDLALPVKESFTGALPQTAASGVTFGSLSGTTSLAGGYTVDPEEPGRFTYLGAIPKRDANYPNRFGLTGTLALYSHGTTDPPWVAEFFIDVATTTFELIFIDNVHVRRVLVDGEVAGTRSNATSTGASMFLPVTLAAAGRHRIRVEMDSNASFQGVRLPAKTDSVWATPKRKVRCLVIGDSFSEPTIVDTGTVCGTQGWPIMLSHLTGWDVWCCAAGGTGYLKAGSHGTIRTRIADCTAFDPDIVIVAAGINDTSSSYANIKTEVGLVLTALADVPIVAVVSPFWARDLRGANSEILSVAQAVKDACTDSSTPYIDLLTPPSAKNLSSTVSRTLTAGGNRLYTAAEVFDWPMRVLVGDASAGNSVEVTTLEGGADTSGGDYNYYLPTYPQTYYGHAVGETAKSVGDAYIDGTGKQTATTGDGTADVFTGSDGTHPTAAGHANIALHVARGLAQVLS